MEGGKRGFSVCSICGSSIFEPTIISLCSDRFCQPCITQYIEVVSPFMASRRDREAVANNEPNTIPCPNCDKTFNESHTLRDKSKDENKSSCPKAESLKGSTNSPKLALSLESDLKDSINILMECQNNFSFVIAQLTKLQKVKLEHFNILQSEVECRARKIVDQIRREADSLLHRLSGAEMAFKTKIKAELGYYKFLNGNAANLKSGLERLLKSNTELVLNIHKTYCQRIQKINLSSKTASVPETLSTKQQVTFTRPLEEFASIETSSENFQMDVASATTRDSNACSFEGRHKWSYRLQGREKSSSLPSGICFWPGDKNVIVTERRNGTILGFYTEKLRPERPYLEIVKKEKFSPVSVVRMDKGAIWCSDLSEEDFPNFAMIDKWTEEIVIFDVHKKTFASPFSQKFSMLNGLAYNAQSEGGFIVTDQFNRSLQMISTTGSIVWTTGDRKSSAFSNPHHIAIDYHNKRILVTDGRDLHFLDLSGNFIRKVSSLPDQSHWDLSGICLMKDGSILVADGSESRVLRLDSRDGIYLEDILNGDSARGIRCMDVSSDHHLALACGDGQISVYKL